MRHLDPSILSTNPCSVRPCRVNLAVLTHNALDDTKRFIKSIQDYTSVPHNIFVLDNASTDGTTDWLQKQNLPNLHCYLSTKNWGVAGGRNRLIEIIDPHLRDDGFMIFCDNDLEFTGPWAENYLEFFDAHPQVGIASAHGHRIRIFEEWRQLYCHPGETAPVDVVSGGFVCWVRKRTAQDVGPFDQELGIFWHEDDDYCIRALSKGWQIYSLPHTPVLHHEHKSGVADEGIEHGGSPKNQRYLSKKWRAMGVVDEVGEIKKILSPKVDFTKRQMPSGIIVEGMSCNLGGYHHLRSQSSFDIPSDSRPREFYCELQCLAPEHYDRFPFSVTVWRDGKAVLTETFSEDGQVVALNIPVPPSASVQKLSMVFEAAFIPFLAGINDWEDRRCSARICCMRLTEVDLVEDLPQPPHRIAAHVERNGINWVAPHIGYDPFSRVNRNIAKRLYSAGRQVKVSVVNPDSFLIPEIRGVAGDYQVWKRLAGASISGGNCILGIAPYLSGTHKEFKKVREEIPGYDSYHALSLCKYDRISPEWVALYNSLDGVWVPSSFHKQIFRQAGVEDSKLSVFPVGVNCNRLNREVVPLRSVDGLGAFNFISVLNWDESDGWQDLILAFAREFTKDDDVALVVYAVDPRRDLRVIISECSKFLAEQGICEESMPKLLILDNTTPETTMECLAAVGHCYVQPARHNGIPLSVFEAMALECPAIVPDSAFYRELFRDEHALFIEGKFENIPKPYYPKVSESVFGQQWFVPNIVSLGQHMRAAYRDPAMARSKGLKARLWIEQHFNSDKTMEWLNLELAKSSSESAAKSHSHQKRVVEIQKTQTLTSTVARHSDSMSPKKLSVETISVDASSRNQHFDIDESLTIGLDIRSHSFKEVCERGIGHYAINHLRALAKLTPAWNYKLLHDGDKLPAFLEPLRDLPNMHSHKYDDVYDIDLDLLHIPDPMSMLPHLDSPFRIAPRDVPISVLMHDIIPMVLKHMHMDHWSNETKQAYMSRLSQMTLLSSVILTNSEATKNDLVNIVGIPEEKIRAVMAGLHMQHSLPPDTRTIAAVLSKFTLSDPFFLIVGAMDPHKDPGSILGAFIGAQSVVPSLKLAIVGSLNDPYKHAFRAELEKKGISGVEFTGFVSRDELNALYATASGLAFTSVYEGFGFPVLEAMSHGCPVITTNVSSLPEVAGDAAIMVDVGDVRAIADAMIRLAKEPNYRSLLSRRGIEQAKLFSWEKTARKTIASWQDVLGPSLTSRSHNVYPSRMRIPEFMEAG